jgi:Cu/Ag efflux pump CusA
MIDHFVALCFRKRLLVAMMALFFAVYGVYAWTQLPMENRRQWSGVDLSQRFWPSRWP